MWWMTDLVYGVLWRDSCLVGTMNDQLLGTRNIGSDHQHGLQKQYRIQSITNNTYVSPGLSATDVLD